MADTKISALPAATTPLAGTEVLPIVQGGTTDQVSVANLTAGRSVSMSGLTLTGGTANGVPYLNASNVVTTGANLVFDSANNRLGVGVASPAATVDAFGVVRISPNASGNASLVAAASTGTAALTAQTTSRFWRFVTSNSDTKFRLNDETAGATRLSVDTSGNLEVIAGNVTFATSGRGIDFSATPGTGTSELLNDYEEGTWTPTVTAASGSITTLTASGNYTKIGRQVTVNINIIITTNGTGASALLIAGMPFNAATTRSDAGVGREYQVTGNAVAMTFSAAGTLQMLTYNNTYPGGDGHRIAASITYNV